MIYLQYHSTMMSLVIIYDVIVHTYYIRYVI